MYPQIPLSTPTAKVVEILVTEVKELMTDGHQNRQTALNTVVYNRYNGRFRTLMSAVRRQVSDGEKKPAARSALRSLPQAFLSSQHSALAMEALDARAPVIK